MGTRIRQVAAAATTVARGELARYGLNSESKTDRFEKLLASTVGVDHARAVNSGTSALVCCLAAVGVGPGDEVLVPAYTWVSSAAAAVMVGAVPVLVEIDESLAMDPADLEAKITPRSKAIVPVHMLNLPADMDAIMRVASKHDLVVVEDACQALGVRYKDRVVGSLGSVAAFSFNQHKNIRCGEGGAFVTNDDELHHRGSMLHDVGSYQRSGIEEGDVAFVGMNFRIPEISSAILLPQLRKLDRQMKARARRRSILADAAAASSQVSTSPHNDEPNAVALSVLLPSAAEAEAFADAHRSVTRLIDTGRHVYANWQPIMARRTFDDRSNPWRDSAVDYTDACPVTTRILERTCHVSTAPELPLPLVMKTARRIRGA